MLPNKAILIRASSWPEGSEAKPNFDRCRLRHHLKISLRRGEVLWMVNSSFRRRRLADGSGIRGDPPARGSCAALAPLYAVTDMMQLHLDEISRNVAASTRAVLLLDRATWHITGKLVRVPREWSERIA
jgi:hypothetical protein